MPKQKYAGRHRPAPSSAAVPTPALQTISPPTPAAATLTPGSGRHRAAATASVPRLAGTGLLLPTAAAATLVLTATGAHLGSSAVDLAPSTVAAQAQSTATQADQRETQEIKINALAAQARGTQLRADRDTARARVTAAAATAATAGAAAKAPTVTDPPGAAASTSTVSNHTWVPYLDAPYTLTSGFGMRWGTMHPGQDFAVPVGTPVLSMSGGTVIFAGWSGGYGNKVEIQYWDGTISWMAHNSVLKVTRGEAVSPGEVVALSGNTGHSTGPHSHLEIHPTGNEATAGAVPPIPWLTAKGIMPATAGIAAPAGTGATD